MKTLSTLALLTAATAAQAYTLDINVGTSRFQNSYDDSNIVGVGIGGQLNNEYHLGLNLARKNLFEATNVDARALSATLDLTYNLSPQGGIRPFIGAGIGAARFEGASIHTKDALATKLFAGIAIPVSPDIEFTLTAQNSRLHGVQELANGPKATITSWDAVAGLRFNF
jgi:opacity protein-like surface antigen